MTRTTTIVISLLAALAAALTLVGFEGPPGGETVWLSSALALLLAAAVVALFARLRRREPAAIQHDVFGPIYPDDQSARRALRGIAARQPVRARRLSSQRALRSALLDCLTAASRVEASNRMNDALDLWRRLSVDPELPQRDRETFDAIVNDCRRVYPTSVALNRARALLNRRGSGRARRDAALQAIDQGRRQGGDPQLLERAREALARGDPLPPSPTVSFSTGTVSTRVWGLKRSTPASRRARADSSIAKPRSPELAALVEAGDIDGLMRIEPELRHAADRHRALLAIVEESYRRRHRPDMRAICERYAWEHVERFEQFLPALRVASSDPLTVPSFQRLAALLMEDGDLQGAERVCRRAVNLGLKDATGQGFEGRLNRIRRQTGRS